MTAKKPEQSRVLYVEDEPLIAMDTEMTLRDLGYDDITTCHNLDQAQKAVDDADGFDLAVLDVNLNGRLSLPIAEQLSQSGTPIVFTTGYNESEEMLKEMDARIIRKPVDAKDLAEALNGAAG